MNDAAHTAAIKLDTVALMASEASRFAMAAAVGERHWIEAARAKIDNIKKYAAEIEMLLNNSEAQVF